MPCGGLDAIVGIGALIVFGIMVRTVGNDPRFPLDLIESGLLIVFMIFAAKAVWKQIVRKVDSTEETGPMK